jgi:hypothetical protein
MNLFAYIPIISETVGFIFDTLFYGMTDGEAFQTGIIILILGVVLGIIYETLNKAQQNTKK